MKSRQGNQCGCRQTHESRHERGVPAMRDRQRSFQLGSAWVVWGRTVPVDVLWDAKHTRTDGWFRSLAPAQLTSPVSPQLMFRIRKSAKLCASRRSFHCTVIIAPVHPALA